MSRSTGLRRILTLKCEAASELASQQMDEPLTRLEGLALWGHLLACASCRRFRRQIRWIREAGRLDDRAGPDEVLSAEARLRIARAIDEAGRDLP